MNFKRHPLLSASLFFSILFFFSACKKDEVPDIFGQYKGTSIVVTSSESSMVEETNFPVYFEVKSVAPDSVSVEPPLFSDANVFQINSNHVYEYAEGDSLYYKAEFFPEESGLIITRNIEITTTFGQVTSEYNFDGEKN